MSYLWSYGVTTVPSRNGGLLARTLTSLAAAGFDRPRLFVDGCDDPTDFGGYGLDVTCRSPRVRAVGNWILSLWELYIRNPEAERFALFQDDLIAYRNLRPYLDRTTTRGDAYWNLFTAPSNWLMRFKGQHKSGWDEAHCVSSPKGYQTGRGALGLVFTRQAVITLLGARQVVEKCLDVQRGWRSIDGMVVNAMNGHGYRELVHEPSLVQHTGMTSTIDKRKNVDGKDEVFPLMRWQEDSLAPNFRGEGFNALELLNTPRR